MNLTKLLLGLVLDINTVGKAPPQTSLHRRLSDYFRGKRNLRLKRLIERLAEENGGSLSIADLGGSADYWRALGFDWMAQNGVRVTCINTSDGELTRGTSGNELISLYEGNACDTRLPTNSFDFVHSNSVVEHVGRWAEMEAFAREVQRLSPFYYVQTPYFWFPVDPHFFRVPCFHWLPVSVRAKLICSFKVGWASAQGDISKAMRIVQSSDILDRAQFRALFPSGAHRFEMFGFLPKSMIVENI